MPELDWPQYWLQIHAGSSLIGTLITTTPTEVACEITLVNARLPDKIPDQGPFLLLRTPVSRLNFVPAEVDQAARRC